MKNIVEGRAPRARSMRRAALATGLTAAVLLPVLVSAGSGSAAAPPPAHPGPTGPNTVGLKIVGPIDETNGFPLWYKDTSGQRLELCLDANDPYCIMGAVPTPGQPLVFPTNFPDEAFWSMADSTLATDGGGGSAILVTDIGARKNVRTWRQENRRRCPVFGRARSSSAATRPGISARNAGPNTHGSRA